MSKGKRHLARIIHQPQGVSPRFLHSWFCSARLADFPWNKSHTATGKMAGLEGIVWVPAALAIYSLGLFFGWSGLYQPDQNPGSRLGVILNAVPVGLFFGTIIYGMIFGHR